MEVMKIINDWLWWVKDLDSEMKRQLALKDKAKPRP